LSLLVINISINQAERAITWIRIALQSERGGSSTENRLPLLTAHPLSTAFHRVFLDPRVLSTSFFLLSSCIVTGLILISSRQN
jgi:hypothetical protein